jgi:uncharacterized protein YdaU (DUF1376 family)
MSLAFFPLYPDDFEADTAHLTFAEDGVYNRLLRLCWRTPGCSVPADRTWLYRRLRALTDEDRATVETVVSEFFTEANGRLSNARLTKEWLAANEAHERRKSAGSKGGFAKSAKTKESGPSNAKAMLWQPEPEPDIKKEPNGSIYRSDTPSTSEEPAEKQPVPKPSPKPTSDGFERFWSVYPRKVAKGSARKAWDRAAKLATEANIIAGAERYAAERAGQDHKFTAHAASWLNAERWKDEVTPAATGRCNDGSGMAIARRAADLWLAQQGGVDFGEDSNAVVPLFPDRRVIGGA